MCIRDRRSGLQLLVAYDNSCGEYSRWQQEIGPGYGASAEGRAAPLLAVNMEGPWPDGLVLGNRPRLSPTFVLVRNGLEIARMEGYRDPADFNARLGQMLQAAR